MNRGFHEMIAEVLAEAKMKRRAKSRLASRCGVNIKVVQRAINLNLLVCYDNPKYVKVTDKGNEFLKHFQALQELCPKPEPEAAGIGV